MSVLVLCMTNTLIYSPTNLQPRCSILQVGLSIEQVLALVQHMQMPYNKVCSLHYSTFSHRIQWKIPTISKRPHSLTTTGPYREHILFDSNHLLLASRSVRSEKWEQQGVCIRWTAWNCTRFWFATRIATRLGEMADLLLPDSTIKLFYFP